MMRYVFFGSPTFAALVLKKMVDAGNPPVALVCNPDKPTGRKKVLTAPATKQLITNSNLPIKIYQPADKKELLTLPLALSAEADFGVVAAYALIIPDSLIKSFGLGLIGVHPSLLPKYRGASPIQSAILAGERVAGTTLFMLDSEVDHGPILASQQCEINDKYYPELAEELAEASGNLLNQVLPRLIAGELPPVEQDHGAATSTRRFESQDAHIKPSDLRDAQEGDITKAEEIHRKIRALNPEPGTFTSIDGVRTKLLRARIENGGLILEKIQKEGKNPVDL
jgi:methionyl-tRNA formyltransferase